MSDPPAQPLLLHCVEPARRKRRFYLLSVQPNLFGEWTLVREWGRIGQSGRIEITTYPDAAQATQALAHWQRRKQRRGYV